MVKNQQRYPYKGYGRHPMTLGYAAQMAEMEKPAFQEFLKSRQVPLV